MEPINDFLSILHMNPVLDTGKCPNCLGNEQKLGGFFNGHSSLGHFFNLSDKFLIS